MPTYRYRCDECDDELVEVMTFEEHDNAVRRGNPRHNHIRNSSCAGEVRQVFDFQFKRSMPEHFNHSIGQYVSNESEAQSALSRQSDEMSERMGFDHAFELVDPSDPKTAGVTDAGLEATERRQREEGGTKPAAIFT